MTVVDRFVQARSHGGSMRPTLQVVHAAETPLRAGYAGSIAENWFGRSAPTSAHFMVDPVELIRMLSDNVVSYAVGPKANGFTLNWEQAGYSRFSRAEWTTADGMAQMDRLGAGLRERGLANGIPLRWASDDDIRAAARGIPGGICFHDDIRRVLGGTTHTDPMPHYPGDLLEQRWADTPNLQEDDMSAAELDTLRADIGSVRDILRADLGSIRSTIESIPGAVLFSRFTAADGATRNLVDFLKQINADTMGGTSVAPVDPAEFAKAMKPLLAEAVHEGMSADNTDQADAIVERIAARLSAPVS